MDRKQDGQPQPPDSQDLSETFYSAMREELMKRLELREHTLALSATFLAALLGYGATTPEFKTYLPLMMGPLALGSAILVTEHASKIGFIAEYLDMECRSYRDRNPSRWQPWEVSDQLRRARRVEFSRRGVGEVLLLLLPLLIALCWVFPSTWDFRSTEVIVWISGGILAFGVVSILARHYYYWHSNLHGHKSIVHSEGSGVQPQHAADDPARRR